MFKLVGIVYMYSSIIRSVYHVCAHVTRVVIVLCCRGHPFCLLMHGKLRLLQVSTKLGLVTHTA